MELKKQINGSTYTRRRESCGIAVRLECTTDSIFHPRYSTLPIAYILRALEEVASRDSQKTGSDTHGLVGWRSDGGAQMASQRSSCSWGKAVTPLPKVPYLQY